jgi:uncharacterized protein YecE (DUF72 family)
MARVLIGTSGWHYESWRGPFFPNGLPIKRQLEYYAQRFETAELNGVFYRTPSLETVKNWREKRAMISFSHGRPLNSSPTGNGFR